MTHTRIQTFDENAPIEDIEAVIPANELDELSAFGDQRDDMRWKIGEKARLWIDERGLPVGQICKIIAKRTDYGHERVRQFLYTSRYYYNHPELPAKYDILRYSIFEHARTCEDPEKVLKAAMDNQLTPGQVKITYLPIVDELKELVSRVPKQYEDEARNIIRLAMGKLRELAER